MGRGGVGKGEEGGRAAGTDGVPAAARGPGGGGAGRRSDPRWLVEGRFTLQGHLPCSMFKPEKRVTERPGAVATLQYVMALLFRFLS